MIVVYGDCFQRQLGFKQHVLKMQPVCVLCACVDCVCIKSKLGGNNTD